MAGHEHPYPEDFHALYDQGTRAARRTLTASTETTGHQRLAEQFSDLAVEYDEATSTPNFVCSRKPEDRLATGYGSVEEAAAGFVRDHCDLWNLSDDDAQTVEVASVSRQGLPTVRLTQRMEGREVFDSEINAAVTGDNEVLSVSGQLFAGTSVVRSARRSVLVTSAEEAIAQAAFDLTGEVYDPREIAPAKEPGDGNPYLFFEHQRSDNDERPAFERPVRIKEVMFPIGEGEFVPAFYMELWLKGVPAFSYVIDAVDTPDVLFRKNLTSHAAFAYRVYNTGDALLRPEDGPAPGTPHPTGVPDGFQAPTIRAELITTEGLRPSDPWLPDDATSTVGNNCIAYADLRRGDGFNEGDVLGQVTAERTFDHTYDHSRDSTVPENLQASIVGMFFHVNWLHDRWYEAGFDEAAGNAQFDNFGRGGLDRDPIIAEASDFSGTDNANMATPADGASPRMQMYTFTGPPGPTRTSNFEALITFHEMGHYITNRLVGNGNGLRFTQARAMGEGWGDFFALTMTSQASDDFASGVFAPGGWTDLTPNFDNNYYFSIRRYPYSADLSKNPLTFRHISANVVLPTGPPRNPIFARGANEEFHNAGEVWCAVLWEVFVNLVFAHGHERAERRALRYIIGGLKLTPSNPTFTQARDAIIASVTALDPGDLDPVWAGFAKRGMGAGAASPASTSRTLTGVVESFETP
ncbi:MAG: M36 family metallopeptidase [Acidobacteriota bacterium]